MGLVAGQSEGCDLVTQKKQQLLESIHAGEPIAAESVLRSSVTQDHLGKCACQILDEKVPRTVDRVETEDRKN